VHRFRISGNFKVRQRLIMNEVQVKVIYLEFYEKYCEKCKWFEDCTIPSGSNKEYKDDWIRGLSKEEIESKFQYCFTKSD
jgi:hypothetical protein